mgnify:CR=1 FL=1
MSIAGIRYALTVPKLSASERLIFIILADRADKMGRCYPSQAWIAKRTGISIRTIIRALRSLEAKGHIERENRFSASGRTSDFIHLRLPSQGDKMAPTKVPNRQTIPTSPYGVGIKEEKGAIQQAQSGSLKLINGGRV